MQNDEPDWQNIRTNAAISVLNSLLETTEHSVLESLALREPYAVAAVLYADALVEVLKLNKDEVKDKLKHLVFRK